MTHPSPRQPLAPPNARSGSPGRLRQRALPWALSALPLLVVLSSCEPSAEDLYAGELPERVDFNFHVKPILSDRCFACHGPDGNARRADLRLDTEDGIRAVARSGLFGGSELLHRIVSGDSAEVMPPRESGLLLSDYEKAVLARWVDQGAEYKPHWSFMAPVKLAPPAVKDARWAKSPIDRFVLARLEREGLKPSPEADRERLIRRVTYDLTGLPPTIPEVDAFLADRSPNAYEKLVDRLLSSPAYGERMASEWLDLARYADSHGYQDDGIHYQWRWRDWVIQSFNRNQRYDEFITWQLAGDLLPHATREQILATGFNRNHPQSAEGGIVDEEYRVEYVSDRVTTVGRGLIGLSMDCARCHDHKYDPITQKDFFRLFGFFNNVDEIGLGAIDGNNGPVLLLPDDTTERKLVAIRQRSRALAKELQAYRTRVASDTGYLRVARAARPELAMGLIGHFPFDEVERKKEVPPRAGAAKAGVEEDPVWTAPNLADPKHPASLRGKQPLVPGKLSNAFAATEGALWSVDEAYVFDRPNPFSLAVWVHPTKPQERAPILIRAMADNGGANRGYELNLLGGKVFVALMHVRSDDAIRVQTRAAVPVNAWTHLGVTYDGTARAAGLKVYINGRPVAVDVLSDDLRRTFVPESTLSARRPPPLQIGGKRVGSEVASFDNGRMDDVRIYDRPLAAAEMARLAGSIAPGAMSGPDLVELHQLTRDREYARRAAALRASIREETELLRGVEDVMVMRERRTLRPTHLLKRGAYDAPAERVRPGTPASLLPFPADLPRNRLGLARWLFATENPLTARVAVNRYWQMLFGTGLVKTADDFGNQGELPSHPELLDHLAVTYRESGWDTKAMLRSIVTSSTYRQSAKVTPELQTRDPENRLLARGPSHRLPAEMIRDGALAASGLLVHTVGGPGTRPYQPEGLWEEKSAGRGALAKYVQDHGDGLYRRSMYTLWKRSSPPPMLMTFDATERNVCTVRRARTNTPPQALGLLNDPQFVEAARVLAERMIAEGGTGPDGRLRYGFRAVNSRSPSQRELQVLRSLYGRHHARMQEKGAGARGLLQVGEAKSRAGLDAAEVAAYTLVANALLNTDEFVTKR
ncbi:MAG: DUF1553 domain-containing protein [Gemmatimonadetes bacterium]|nr:DUF1553 domain-containing protein [Gemmatimonadota bacterium]